MPQKHPKTTDFAPELTDTQILTALNTTHADIYTPAKKKKKPQKPR